MSVRERNPILNNADFHEAWEDWLGPVVLGNALTWPVCDDVTGCAVCGIREAPVSDEMPTAAEMALSDAITAQVEARLDEAHLAYLSLADRWVASGYMRHHALRLAETGIAPYTRLGGGRYETYERQSYDLHREPEPPASEPVPELGFVARIMKRLAGVGA